MGGSCPRVAVSSIINNRCRPLRRLRAQNRQFQTCFAHLKLSRAPPSGTVPVAVRIRGPCISLRSGPRLRGPPHCDQRSAAGPRPASCRWRRRQAACSFFIYFFEREAISSLTACAALSAFTAIAFAAASGASPSYGVSYVSCEVRSVTSPAFPENSTLKTAVCRARSNSNR